MLFVIKKEFFGLKKGKWTKCNELEANNSTLLEYSSQKFHSNIIACSFWRKGKRRLAYYLSEDTA